MTARIPIVSRPGLESPYPIAIAIAAGVGFVWVLNLGLQVVGASQWQYPGRSCRPLVGRVQRSGATGVFLGGYLEDGSALFKALRASLPTEVRMRTPDGFNGSDLVAEIGSSAEGMTMSLPGRTISALPPAGRKFVSEFGASLIARAQTDTPYGAQATQLMLDAIARSDGTRASVAHQLLTAKVSNGILGNVRTAKLCPGRGNVGGLRGA